MIILKAIPISKYLKIVDKILFILIIPFFVLLAIIMKPLQLLRKKEECDKQNCICQNSKEESK